MRGKVAREIRKIGRGMTVTDNGLYHSSKHDSTAVHKDGSHTMICRRLKRNYGVAMRVLRHKTVGRGINMAIGMMIAG